MDEFDTQELLRLTKENNRILKKMNSRQRAKNIFGFLKFAVVVVFLVLSYVKLQPYLAQIGGLYKQVNSGNDSMEGFKEGFEDFDLGRLSEILQ